MNDCTDRHWKTRHARRSGSAVISVDHSIPWSIEANTERQTVSGRCSTEFVMISGQRKLFLCQLAYTRP